MPALFLSRAYYAKTEGSPQDDHVGNAPSHTIGQNSFAEEGSLLIHQNARIYLSSLDQGYEITHELAEDRHAWLQILRGSVNVNDHELMTSDGVAVSDESLLQVVANRAAEIMLFDLA